MANKVKPNYILIPLITLGVSATGGWLTSFGLESGWYDQLIKPSWTPTGQTIGLVWTLIYILATASALIVWNKAKNRAEQSLVGWSFTLNAGLNIHWSALFFKAELIGFAVWGALFLLLSVVALILISWPINRPASLLLWPYAVWVTFATYLNFIIWNLN